jgi:PhzF family phenazine biosynthesis protein
VEGDQVTQTRSFRQIDVFTAEPYRGNPLAVVHDATGLDDAQMQRFAHWTNLSETTFLLPPDPGSGADYRVRIFTTGGELPFAGHPTLGSCHAWLEAGGAPANPDRVVQQCAAGLIPVRRDGDRLAFAAPPLLRSGPVDDADLAAAVDVLGIGRDDVVDANWIDNGPGWMGVLLASADQVLALRPRSSELKLGVAGAQPAGSATDLEVRAFYPSNGSTMEDPVTGSLNAGLAQWLTAAGRLTTPYLAGQGTMLGRAGRVYVSAADGDLWIGGDSVTCIEGTVTV